MMYSVATIERQDRGRDFPVPSPVRAARDGRNGPWPLPAYHPDRKAAPAPPADALAANLKQHAEHAQGAYADSTERALKADTRIFIAWCIGCGRAALPASPETIAAFVDAMAETRAPATVRRYCASVAMYHRAAGLDSPTAALQVRLALKRMHRAKGRAQKQAAPLNEAEFRRCLDSLGGKLIDRRDKALLAVGRCGMLRRSELVALLVEDLTFDPDDGSATVLLRRSKGDQEAAGAVIYLPPFAARLARSWLDAAAIRSGPIFRSVDQRGSVGQTLHAGSVPRLLARIAKRAGIAADLSGHSLRVGMCQDLTAAGFDLAGIMQAGRWKSPEMPARYSARLAAKRGAVAGFYAE